MDRRVRRHLAIVAAACALPRLAVLLHERGAILGAFTEKSDDFARTFVEHGTFGFIPGVPSASTQPLYGFFLVPVYRLFGRNWEAVGLAQIAVAVATAWVVYEIGRRFLSPRIGLAGALIATLQPYLVWHDVHVNREILDQLLGALAVLLALLAAERRSIRLAAALGVVAGLAILSNSRLLALPLVLAGYLLWRRLPLAAAGALVAATALAVTPWVVRNQVRLGCPAITTDAKALWKANNEHTYSTLRRGGWIDDVPNIPGTPPTPEMVAGDWYANHHLTKIDECAQMRYYQHRVVRFWLHHPGEKAKLAGQATVMLWSPRLRRSGPAVEGSQDASGPRRYAEPLYAGFLYAFALGGLFLVGRRFLVLALAFVAYETLAAMVFAGTTRYRVPWDFLLALLAAAALDRLVSQRPSSSER